MWLSCYEQFSKMSSMLFMASLTRRYPNKLLHFGDIQPQYWPVQMHIVHHSPFMPIVGAYKIYGTPFLCYIVTDWSNLCSGFVKYHNIKYILVKSTIVMVTNLAFPCDFSFY